jgi:hypothetical protein
VGKALRKRAENGGGGGGAVSPRRLFHERGYVLAIAVVVGGTAGALPTRQSQARASEPSRIDRGRFTAVFYPHDRALAASLLDGATRTDTFPGLPRPTQRVLVAIAPDKRRFREWVGPGAPEWGAAITFPDSRRIVMQGRSAGADAGDPREVLRHELAHLALHEFLDDLPPRWFDEGYASYSAREWNREDMVAANLALALRGTPSFSELDSLFGAGATSAQRAYALAYRAVVDLAALDSAHGLAGLFANWRSEGSLDRGMRSTYGLTLVDFERRWQQRTRMRYGALALAGDVTFGGVLILLVIFPLHVARRQRARRQMAALVAAEDAADRAARASALEALLRGDDGTDFWDDPPTAPGS